MSGDDRETSSRVETALQLLVEEAQLRVRRHSSGHLLAAQGEVVDLEIRMPTNLRGARLDQLAADATASLDRAVDALLTHRAAFRPGAVYCLRCNNAGCEHATPTAPRHVFAGYGGTGLPRFEDFAQVLLERSDPRVDRLYGNRPALLAHTFLAKDLSGDLLAPYRDNDAGYRLHGQVAAGWYAVPSPTGRPEMLALTFQVVSTRPDSRAPRRYGLNVLGLGPEGEPLEHLFDRLGELPWTPAVRQAQEEVEAVEREAAKGRKGTGKGKGGEGERWAERRLTSVLNDLAKRLEKDRRARDRKTKHGRERHAQSDRPTHMALADLARAGDDDVLVDRRQETLVVLGDKGRAHVFNPAGKLVTSVRYNPESIERRRQRDQWRPASAEEISTLRDNVAAVGSG